jgi:hypothetical protein
MVLGLYTTIVRIDEDGDPIECDAVVHFTVESFTPGYPATRTDPAEGPEIEVAFESAELDGHPGKLTDAELSTLRTWFDAHHEQAWDCANDNYEPGPDPDDARDRGWDRWMGDAA